jgi:predicted amidohydrolase YtcJ
MPGEKIPEASADLIFANGKVYTVDASSSWAEAIAVRNGRIVFVGATKSAQRLKGPTTEIIDLQGRMVLPGLGDVHNHHTRGGQLDLFELSFQASVSFNDMLDLVKARVATTPPGEWVCGGIWSSAHIPHLRTLEAKAALDAVSPDHPVMLRDDSLHNRWVNSAALKRMGVTANTPDPDLGHIVKDAATNVPVGLLLEKASALAEQTMMKSLGDPLQRETASTRRAVEILNSYGVTAYQDANTTLPMLKALTALDRQGELNAWCVGSLPVFNTLSGTELFGDALIARREEFRTTHVQPNFIKLFMDGVPMTRTAAMLDAYKPDEQGRVTVCRSFLRLPEVVEWIAKAETFGLGVKIHCAGDAAVHDILDAVEIVRKLRGPSRVMHHIAHASFIDPNDLPRFKKLNVVADLCPAIWFPCAITEANMAVMDQERAGRYWPNRDLHQTGALLAAGSDWPVIGLPDPWFGLEGMVTRRNPKGGYPGALWPEQALDLKTAIEVYTRNPAIAMGLGHLTGTIEVGKSADLAVLDQNLFEVAPERLSKTKVLATYFEGRLVHRGG